MAKRTKAELASMGKKITSAAKKIRKEGGVKTVSVKKYSMSWETAMKKAGQKLKGKM